MLRIIVTLFCLIVLEISTSNGQSNQRGLAPTFLLYTRNNARNPERLRWNDSGGSLRSQYFNGGQDTKLIVHGFIDSPSLGEWMTTMKDRFLSVAPMNVIIVDWSNANQFPYGRAVANSRQVGRMVGQMIRSLGASRNSSPAQFHILGHSLGAHVAGFAGKALNGQLGQITGLDPAGPYFEGASPQARLWRTDAQLVDVLHTDAGRLGMWQQCGNVDIYFNGGRSQPGCTQDRLTFMTRGALNGARTLFACDHQRAVDYYTEAITASPNNGALIARQCDSYENYRAGRCNSCGPNGGRCVPVGVTRGSRNRPIRQSSSSSSSSSSGGGGGNSGGGRFFITTASSPPFFRGK